MTAERGWVPRADQDAVLAFLEARQRAAVWAPGGSGKTSIAATWLEQAMFDRFEVPRALIVAPRLVARDGWPQELRRWAHLRRLAEDFRVLGFEDLGLTVADVVTSTLTADAKPRSVPRGMVWGPGLDVRQGGLIYPEKRETKRRLQTMRERLHVCSWDAWPWLVQAYGRNFPYQAVIFDEASFLRDQASERHKAAAHALQRLDVVTHVLELTASPAANHQEAVYAQLDLLRPGVLGPTLTAFREEYCLPDRKNWSTGQVYSWRIAPGMREQFEAVCKSLAVSVPSTLDVPLVSIERHVELPDEAWEAYRAIENTGVWRSVVCGSEAVVRSKLRQIASGFVYEGPQLQTEDDSRALFLHNEKIERLQEDLEACDGPVLVAFEFKEELRRLKATLGKHVQDIRTKGAKEAFVAGKLKALAVHPASAGHGVDGLQHVCRDIAWLTVPQDRELFDQANWRVHRHGTTAPTVYCRAYIGRGTVEQDIWTDTLPNKRAIEDRILSATRI